MNLRPAALLLTCAILSVGCAAADASTDVDSTDVVSRKPVLVENAVNVDQDFSDAVTVEDDALVIPTSKMDRKVEIGSIVAGDRSSKKGASNPYGFLRKVTDIQKSGKTTKIVTEPAQLAEWIQEGRLDFGSKTSLLTGKKLPGGLKTKTLKTLADDQQATGAGEGSGSIFGNLKEAVTVENFNVTVGASFDGYLDISTRFKVPTGAKYKAVLNVTPAVSADIVWKITNSASVEGELEGPPIVIPLTTPVPMTVTYTPKLKCSLSASGEAKFTVGANINANLTVGFEGKGGLQDWPSMNNLSQEPQLSGGLALRSVEGKATVSTTCEVVGTLELRAFEIVTFGGTMGPWLTLDGAACARADEGGLNTGFTLHQKHGFTESINASIDIPFAGKADKELWSGRQTMGEGYIAGDETTCDLPVADSCVGKPDGFYCSEITTFSGYVCEAGQILIGHNCENVAMTCASGTRDSIQCQ